MLRAVSKSRSKTGRQRMPSQHAAGHYAPGPCTVNTGLDGPRRVRKCTVPISTPPLIVKLVLRIAADAANRAGRVETTILPQPLDRLAK